MNDDTIIQVLNSEDWYVKNNIDLIALSEEIYKNEMVQKLPDDFPIFRGRTSWIPTLISTEDFIEYYSSSLKRSSERTV